MLNTTCCFFFFLFDNDKKKNLNNLFRVSFTIIELLRKKKNPKKSKIWIKNLVKKKKSLKILINLKREWGGILQHVLPSMLWRGRAAQMSVRDVRESTWSPWFPLSALSSPPLSDLSRLVSSQVDRVSKRGTSEKQIGFWKMVHPLLRQSPAIKIQKVFFTQIHLLRRIHLLRCPGHSLTPLVSRSLEGRTQFCLMQPSLYYTSCFLLLWLISLPVLCHFGRFYLF